MLIKPNKPQILYAPMLSTFGGGSVRGFRSGGGGGLAEFIMTLDVGNTHQRTGDSDTDITSFFTSAGDPGYFSSTLDSNGTGTTGYYGFILAEAVDVNIRCKGASGGLPHHDNWDRCRGYGRDVDGDFSLSAGTEVHFFAGYPGQDLGTLSDTNTGGPGGGASVVYMMSGSSKVPLVIGAGGSSFSVYQGEHTGARSAGSRLMASARSLEGTGTTAHSDYHSWRNSNTSTYFTASNNYGIGRSSAGGGGGGWSNSGRDVDGSINSKHGGGLDYGANGGQQSNGGGDGGFGGGGGSKMGNGYAGAGGGYFGGIEVGSSASHNAYHSYTTQYGDTDNDDGAPISYIASSTTSWSDNGLHGSPATSGDDPSEGGVVTFTFNVQ